MTRVAQKFQPRISNPDQQEHSLPPAGKCILLICNCTLCEHFPVCVYVCASACMHPSGTCILFVPASSLHACVCVCALPPTQFVCIPQARTSPRCLHLTRVGTFSHVPPSAMCLLTTSISHSCGHLPHLCTPSLIPALPQHAHRPHQRLYPPMCAPPPCSLGTPRHAHQAREHRPPASPTCLPRGVGTPGPAAPGRAPGRRDSGRGGGWGGEGAGERSRPTAHPRPPPPPRGAPTNRGRRRPGSSRKARESFFTHTFSSFAPGAAAIKKKTNHSAHGKPAAGPGLLLLPAAGPAARTCGDVLRLGRPIAHGSILRRSLLGKDRCQQLKNTPRRGESRRQ